MTTPAKGEPGYKRACLKRAVSRLFRADPEKEQASDQEIASSPPSGEASSVPLEPPTAPPEPPAAESVVAQARPAEVEQSLATTDGASPSLLDADVPLAGTPRWTPADLELISAAELADVRSNRNDPPNPADALRASGASARLLDEMELACCWLHHEAAHEELQLPRFVVTARPSRILEPELRQMAIVLRAALDMDEQFAITWDLRKLVPPSLSALSYGSQWMSDNAADIERLGQSITVLVSSPVTRVCANLCARVCNPPQPLKICTTDEQATAFAREVHERRLQTEESRR